ncbi:MAG TPA: DUF882 domain-containing protein [Polyangiaceae bacterium]|nr:DUF882 domain-containing protein [Polyangiaceae bacterium]
MASPKPNIRRKIAAFALAGLALMVSIGAGQRQRPAQQRASKPKAAAVEPVSPPAAEAVAVGPANADQQIPVARPPLVLLAVNGGDSVVLIPQRDDGGFSDEDLQRAAFAFSQQSPGKVHPLAPRLLDLVYRCMRHFDASVVRVVSGYRRDRAGSRHTQGRAVDMSIDGVSNDKLAAFVRDLGFVGVGFYPRSAFVHLDVREASYFWIDDSAPNQPSRLVPVFEAQARSADAAARARGETPNVYVPNNRSDDAAAAKVYARRARERRTGARP